MSAAMSAAASAEDLFVQHQQMVWGVGYRILGSAADADDLVQDTFVKFLERPPDDVSSAVRPWLIRVAVNRARDGLRLRKSRGYQGPWLPSPVPDERLSMGLDAEGRYSQRESATIAFLLALEALTEKQRAVLVLRDVMDLSGAETASALELSEPDVKVSLHRARKALERYDASRLPMPAAQTMALGALSGLVTAVMTQDLDAVLELLAPDAISMSDGGSEFRAAKNVVDGRARVAKLLLGLVSKFPPESVRMHSLSGMPALVVTIAPSHARQAPRTMIQVSTDSEGHIVAVYAVLASAKLTAVD